MIFTKIFFNIYIYDNIILRVKKAHFLFCVYNNNNKTNMNTKYYIKDKSIYFNPQFNKPFDNYINILKKMNTNNIFKL